MQPHCYDCMFEMIAYRYTLKNQEQAVTRLFVEYFSCKSFVL